MNNSKTPQPQRLLVPCFRLNLDLPLRAWFALFEPDGRLNLDR